MMAADVKVHHLALESNAAALLAVVLLLLVAAVVVVITLLEKMIDVTAIMNAGIVIVLVARMIGEDKSTLNVSPQVNRFCRDRDAKEDREEVRENGTSGEDRKGDIALPSRVKN
jgi:hypothetical protein